jgi:GTP-binding protein
VVQYTGMLVDDVTITIKAGNGGNGAVSFRRNAQTAKGGPDGGNGGNGGNLYFAGSHNISDLSEFRFKKKAKAEDGVPGKKFNLYGRNGEDLTIVVPIGTRITDTKTNEIVEITNEAPQLLAKGGKGGRGNNEFKSATNQVPKEFEKGEPGEEKIVRLELRLIADIGLVGLPNVGKSSLLAVLTNAKPRIGDFPFTTLEPNLGVMGQTIIADNPGLIEHASKGKGLGIQFLKHIEKTKLLVHCIAATDPNPLASYETILKEFDEFNNTLSKKPEIIALTKTDLVDEKELKEKLKLLKKIKKPVHTVTLADDASILALKEVIQQKLQALDKTTAE